MAFCGSPTRRPRRFRVVSVVVAVVVVRSRLIMFFVCPYAYQEAKDDASFLLCNDVCVWVCGVCVIIVSDLMRTLM